MNSYGSNIRTYIARNVAELTLNPPNDLTFTGQKKAICRTAVVNPAHNFPWNINGNFFLRQFGLFCNLGESLVLKNPAQRLDMVLELWTFRERNVIPDPCYADFVAGSKNITGIALDVAIYSGLVIIDGAGNPYIVDTVLSPTSATLCDYARWTGRAGSPQLLFLSSPRQVANYRIELPDLSLLNTLYDYEAFIPSNKFASVSSPDTDKTLFIVSIENQQGGSAEFITKSIPATYAGDKAIFDAYIEIEFTPVIDPLVVTQSNNYLMSESVTVAENVSASVA